MNFIETQVKDGVQNTAEMQRHTETFVRNVIFDGKQLPSRLNRRSYPTKRDYWNLIYHTRIQQLHSILDEVNSISKNSFMATIFFWPKTAEVEPSITDDVNIASNDVLLSSNSYIRFLLIHQTKCSKNFCWNTDCCVYWMLHIKPHKMLYHCSSYASKRTLITLQLRYFSLSLKIPQE